MNISSVSPNSLPSAPVSRQGGSAEAKIRSLEQKLQTLNAEKQKAIRNKDEEEKKKLEKQIQELEKQIRQLKQQEKAKKKAGTPGAEKAALREAAAKLSGTGRYQDVYA
ncbi:hypothetical protein D3Z51_00280 [Clostridiaceae bacterium]|nr:hypothetical protein [Clostridiaceae bacterium]RKI16518.1 hypothetical protein D7V81_04630 [bacterium 1XD21-70]